MPRLIAIEGPESGVALPVRGALTVLAVGRDQRVTLSQGGAAGPSAGALIRRAPSGDAAGSEAFSIERFAAPDAPSGPPLFVNGEAVEGAPLHHGDLISYAAVTLIFDCDDVGRADTALAPAEDDAYPPPPARRLKSGRRPEEPPRAAAKDPRRPATPVSRPSPEPARAAKAAPRQAPPPSPPPEPDFLSGDSIQFRQKAYQDAEALLRALDDQEAALRAGRPAAPLPAPGARAASPAPSPDPAGGTSRRRRDAKAAEARPEPAPAREAPRERRLTFLLKVATAVGATLDLAALLARLLDLVFEEIRADRGTILLVDKAAKKLRSMAGKRRGASPGEPPNVRVSRTMIKEALSSQESILAVDAMADERFRLGESVASAGIRSAMCVPIVRDGRPLGVIHLDTGDGGAGVFTREDLDLLSAIASIVSVAIENARLYQEAGERERIRAELTLASTIQGRLLPKAAPSVPSLDVAGRTIPAKELGGDIFDFIEDPARGTLHVLVGDVSGKGVGAAMVMAMARSYIRPLAAAYVSPKEVLVRANRLLYGDTARDMFMSAVLLLWDEAGRRLTYCGAGQEHIVIVRSGSRRCESFPAGGIALMMVDEAEGYLADQELALGRGDLVLLYSDGVIESRAPSGEFYGLERLTAALPAIAREATSQAVVERICEEVRAFAGTAEQHDDITVVALRLR